MISTHVKYDAKKSLHRILHEFCVSLHNWNFTHSTCSFCPFSLWNTVHICCELNLLLTSDYSGIYGKYKAIELILYCWCWIDLHIVTWNSACILHTLFSWQIVMDFCSCWLSRSLVHFVNKVNGIFLVRFWAYLRLYDSLSFGFLWLFPSLFLSLYASLFVLRVVAVAPMNQLWTSFETVYYTIYLLVSGRSHSTYGMMHLTVL